MILAFTVTEWGMLFSMLAASIILPSIQMVLAWLEKQAKLKRDEALAAKVDHNTVLTEKAATTAVHVRQALETTADNRAERAEVLDKTMATLVADVAEIKTTSATTADAVAGK